MATSGKVFIVEAKDGKRTHYDISDVVTDLEFSIDPEIEGIKEEELIFNKSFSATAEFTFEAGEGYGAFTELLKQVEVERFKAAFEEAKKNGAGLIVVTRAFSTSYYLVSGKPGMLLYLYPKDDEEAFFGENELKKAAADEAR